MIIRGEPGIGKSRLAGHAMDEARRRGFMVHRSAALDFGWVQGQDAARLLLRDLLGLDPDSTDVQRAQAVVDAVESELVEDGDRAHLLDLLNLPSPPPISKLNMRPWVPPSARLNVPHCWRGLSSAWLNGPQGCW